MTASMKEGHASPSELGRAATSNEKLVASVGLVVLLASCALLWAFKDSLGGLREPLRERGLLGVLVFVLVFALWGLSTLPSIPLMALAGLIYGPWIGAFWSVVGTSIAATLTFWIGHRVARQRVRHWRRHYSKLRKILDLVEDHPFIAVLIVRSSGLFPLTLMNYGFGATGLRFRYYMALSMLTTIPSAALYSGLGDVLYRGTVEESVTPGAIAWVVTFALISAAVVVVSKRHYARS